METKQCRQCSKTFQITDGDKSFYSKLDLTIPTHCPECRFQRRLAWRNSRNLYKRDCDLCGTAMIGVYSPDKKYTVYCHDCYYSDKWDPLEYGREFDFSRPFFEQFNELMKVVPHAGTNNQECENSGYLNLCWKTSNSYLCFGSDMCDESFYCTDAFNCRSSFNLYMCSDMELSSYSVDCTNSYNTHYSQECDTVRDSYFCFDVRSSNNCFGSAGLRNKEYYIFNKPVAKEQWHGKVEKLLRENTVDGLYEMAETAWNVVPRKSGRFVNTENVSGDHITDSSNVRHCFDLKEGVDVKYVTHAVAVVKDSMDADNTGAGGELMYEYMTGYGYNMISSTTCYNGVSFLRYCYEVQSSSDCFGSIGLRKQSHIILNKKYSEEEYKALSAKIIDHMKETGEWSEFFPIALSPFGYNETEAQLRFPLYKETVEKNGYEWKEPEQKKAVEGLPTCSNCSASYKVIEQEQKFLAQQNLPQPRLCPDCRFTFLFNRRNPYQLWHRQCMCTQPEHDHGAAQCTTEFDTTYAAERKEIVYCNDCYAKEIY